MTCYYLLPGKIMMLTHLAGTGTDTTAAVRGLKVGGAAALLFLLWRPHPILAGGVFLAVQLVATAHYFGVGLIHGQPPASLFVLGSVMFNALALLAAVLAGHAWYGLLALLRLAPQPTEPAGRSVVVHGRRRYRPATG